MPWQSFQLGQSEKASCRRWHSHCFLSEDGRILSRDSKDKSRFSVHPRRGLWPVMQKSRSVSIGLGRVME